MILFPKYCPNRPESEMVTTTAKLTTLQLAACTDFKERQNIRGALRELKGIRLDGEVPVGPRLGRRSCPLTSPKPENGRVFPKQTNYKSVDENSFLERKYNRNLEKSGSTRARFRGANESVESSKSVERTKNANRTRELDSLDETHETKGDILGHSSNSVQKASDTTHDILKSRRKLFTEHNGKSPSEKFNSLISNFEKSSQENNKKQPLTKKNLDKESVPKSNVKEILSESFMNRINEIKTTFEKHKDTKPKFRSYLYAGNLTTPTQELDEDKPKPVQRCVSVSVVESELASRVNKTNDIVKDNDKDDNKVSVIKRRPVSLALSENNNNNVNNQLSPKEGSRTPKRDLTQTPRTRTRRVSYRTSAFAPSSQSNEISPVLSHGRLRSDSTDQDQVDSKVVNKASRKSALNQKERSKSVAINEIENIDNVDRKLNGRQSVPALESSVKSTNNNHLNNSDTHHISRKSGQVSRHPAATAQLSVREAIIPKPKERRVLVRRSGSGSRSNMKADTSRRHTSDSTVVIQNSKNDLLNDLKADDISRLRSKSQGCSDEIIMNENKMDVSVKKRKSGLSRKNRVDSSDSLKSVRKFKRKDKSDSESLTSPIIPQPHADITNMLSVNQDNTGIQSQVVQNSQVRRKLPDLPVFKGDQELENDETVHERTIRLLQERRKDRLCKIIKEKEVETKSTKSKATPEKIKDLQERLERSDSKRKACRVRRELQLLNRETQLKSPVAINLEAEFSAIMKAGEAVKEKENIQIVKEKDKIQSPIRRSHSDICRKPAKLELEIQSRGPANVNEKQLSSAVDDEVKSLMSQPLTPETKIEMIGSLMQEEAKLQEKLRRSTSFQDKRKMRAEVKQLREKRNALEGASLPTTTTTLQRSASVSSGVITHASPGENNNNGVVEPVCVDKQQTIDELRKQLSETTDYDEKRKIRLALRQLRQQSKDGTAPQTGLQRSQSFIHRKPSSETEVKTETQSSSGHVTRSRSLSDSKGQGQVGVQGQVVEERIKKEDSNATHSKPKVIESCSVVDKERSNNLQSVKDQSDSRNTDRSRRKSGSDLSGNKQLSNKPPVPISHKQTHTNVEVKGKPAETGALPPRAPKRHSFALGTESKFVNQTKSIFEIADKISNSQLNKNTTNNNNKIQTSGDGQNYVNEDQSLNNKHVADSQEIQQNGQSNDVKFKSKFANILISRANVERRKSTSDLISETNPSSNLISHDSKKPIRSETSSLRVKDIENPSNKSSDNSRVKGDTDNNNRLTPNIEWLEDKKRTIPTPNELDKLMSSMDIEAAFSQILDAVETIPTNGDIVETVAVPDSPIMEEDNESSSSSIVELTNINESKNNMDKDVTNISVSHNKSDRNVSSIKDSNHKMDTELIDINKPMRKKDKDIVSNHKMDPDSVNNARDNHDDVIVMETVNHVESVLKLQSNEINDTSSDKLNGDLGDVEGVADVTGETSGVKTNGAITGSGDLLKSEKTIELRRDLSLDVSKNPDSSAISVIHGDDGTVTVQEVNRMEDGDSVITEWKKVRRTQSKSEMRETDTVIEKKVTSPGGSSQTYEKDVSKTKRKITSRGSEYFSRNHYNIRKRKDLEGEEIVEHELDSESANMSVSKNESWGERSEAKVVLNRDGSNEIKPKRLSITKNESDGKLATDVKTSTVTNVSSGYGSVSPSDEHDVGAVVEAHLGRPTGCPQIVSPLQNVTAVEDSVAILELTCRGNPLPTVTWYKGDNLLVEDEHFSVKFDSQAGVAKLEISPVRREDFGDYKCVVRNSLGSASSSGKLTVKNKTTTLPWFQTKLDDVIIMEGQSITLECQVSDVDKVMWFKDGIVQRNSPDLRQTFDGKVARLEIIEVYLDDDGIYSCVISNGAGENGCSCRISVKESQSKDSIVPMFLRKLDTQICDVGDTAIFEAEVIGSPEPTVTWFVNKAELKQDGGHTMVYDGRIARLVLKNVALSFGGKIECVAENNSGRISCDCMLVVQEVKRPPVIKRQLSNLTFASGKVATLQCQIDSDLDPEVTWRKNGRVIGHTFDFKQTFVDGTAKLEIGNVCTQDSGKYECVLKNLHGEVATSCYLTVTDEVPKSEETKPQTKDSPTDPVVKRSLPASFTPKVDNEQITKARSSASKVMLVRQGSLRNMGNESQTPSVKRTGSFHGVTLLKDKLKSPSEVIKQKVESVMNNAEAKVVFEDKVKSPTNDKVVSKVGTVVSKTEPKVLEKIEAPSPNTGRQFDNNTNSVKSVDSIHKDIPQETTDMVNNVNSKPVMSDVPSKSEHEDKVLNSGQSSVPLTRDVNSNITKSELSNKDLGDKKKALKLELQIDSNKPTQKSDNEKQTEKNLQDFEKAIGTTASEKKSLVTDKSPLGRLKVGGEIRRTQSSRLPGSEKPEWLQVKLRKVTNTPLSDKEKQSIEKNTSYTTEKASASISNDQSNVQPSTPISVQKQTTLSRSQSARVVDKKTSPVLKDSTNSPDNDPARKTPIKLTPVSERAKLFLANDSKSPSGKSSPTDIIAKAINLSRTESMKSPIRNRPLVIQRSGSFRTEAPSSQSGDITLDLSPQQSQGQNKGQREPGKPITVWDPTTPSCTNMDYSKITDEEELNKMLSACENFEERKKLRARIKELRDIERAEWERKRQEREKNQVDFIKEKHRQADLEKQKKLDQFAEQAKQPHEQHHLEVAERNLKEKYRQADIAKQKQLEAFDRMAGKDVKQTSKVTTEVSSDGKTTTTTRKVETVTSISGKGATGRPAEEIAPQMLNQFINATSPSISGQLSVKTQSWSSRDGVTRTSEKQESWGAKPVNPFKAADAANAKTNPLVAYTFAKKAATTMKRNAVTIKQEVLNFCQQNTAEYNEEELSPPKAMARSPSAIKTMLLEWCKAMTREYTDKIEITNFSTSWNDGIAFCALIHHFYPESFDFYALDPKHRRKNFELAFDTAEKYADIAPLLDVEDMVRMKKPDWKCVFTYVQSFYRKLKDHDMNKVKGAES